MKGIPGLALLTCIMALLPGAVMAGNRHVKHPEKLKFSTLSDIYKDFANSSSGSVTNDPGNKMNRMLPPGVSRPNVIIILADDLDAVYTPQYFPEVLPVIDSLEKKGLVFTNSFTPMSICCPSRSATLTGAYAHTNGVYRNGSVNGGWEAFKHNEPFTLPTYLSQSGYRTAMIGKYLNGYGKQEPAQPIYGWTDGFVFTDDLNYYKGYDYKVLSWNGGSPVNDTTWKVAEKGEKRFGNKENDYSTDVLTASAISFLQKTEEKDEQPFFLFLTPTAPHIQLLAAPRYAQLARERWEKVPVPITPNYYNDHGKLETSGKKKPQDKPSFLKSTWKKRVRQKNRGVFYYNLALVDKVPKSIKSFKQAIWYTRLTSLYALNDMIKGVISTLKQNGEWDNTLLIFTSDNGYSLGAHALLHKSYPYEESIRVPMVIAGGDSLHLNVPGKTEEWVTNLDLMPTILDLAGVSIPESVEGISLLPLLYSDSISQFRDKFVMEYLGPGQVSSSRLIGHPKLMLHLLPSYILDEPSYNAIRMKVKTEMNGISEERVYKYMEWQKNPTKKVLKFSDRYRQKDPELMAKIASGNKKTLALKAKAEEVETELYDLTEDPYELDNLLYYKPEEYKDLAWQLKMAMREIILRN